MLGTRKNTIKESLELTGTPAFLDYKYDGLRVQIHNKKGEIELFSRNLDNITKQFPEVVEFIKDNFSDLSFVLDTECVGYDFDKEEFLEFQILSRRILTKEISVVSHINVVVKAFDILYLNGKTLIDVNYEKRREILEGIFINRELVQKLHFNTDKLKD
jgi:DNA ligase-1